MIDAAYEEIRDKLEERILRLYETVTPDGETADTVTGFHVRQVVDPKGHELELHHNYMLARKKQADWAVYICPSCGNVFEGSNRAQVTCTSCERRFRWAFGPATRGTVRCSQCRKAYRLYDLYEDPQNGPRFKLVAVESYSSSGKRGFQSPTEQDVKNIELAERRCLEHATAQKILATKIPPDRRDARPLTHGFTRYGQLFGPRQLLGLSYIADAVSAIDDDEARFALAMALSDAAGSNNLMCRYAVDWLKLTPAFGLHGFDVVTRPVEGNVWGTERGRGSYKNCVRKARKAYLEIQTALNSAANNKPISVTRQVACMPAQSLGALDLELMDAIVTDPPYFDNLDYAELSDFYYQWLRVALREKPPFDLSHSIIDKDIARLAASNGTKPEFGHELGTAFRATLAKVKSGGIVAFSFHHAKKEAWLSLGRALDIANLAPYDLTFARSELDNGFHSSSGNIKTDAIFYCREREFVEQNRVEDLVKRAIGTAASIETLKPIDVTSTAFAVATATATTILDRTQVFDRVVESAAASLDSGSGSTVAAGKQGV